LSFDLSRSLRRLKPERRRVKLRRRADAALPFLSETPSQGPELLLDTCVYIDILEDRVPERVLRLFESRLSNHSGVALAELTHPFGRLDPWDSRTAIALSEIAGTISDIPEHRLSAPSIGAMGEAGILAGIVARLSDVETAREQALLNDAMLYLQAVENGHVVLTRNVREFDYFDQILPCNRMLFYSPTT
jgi:predicted nucleic acid-binding protein